MGSYCLTHAKFLLRDDEEFWRQMVVMGPSVRGQHNKVDELNATQLYT